MSWIDELDALEKQAGKDCECGDCEWCDAENDLQETLRKRAKLLIDAAKNGEKYQTIHNATVRDLKYDLNALANLLEEIVPPLPRCPNAEDNWVVCECLKCRVACSVQVKDYDHAKRVRDRLNAT